MANVVRGTRQTVIYGSVREGVSMPKDVMIGSLGPDTIYTRRLGEKLYELTDHLGNVRGVISDRMLADIVAGVPGKYRADVRRYSNLYPYGMEMPGRYYAGSGYRYGYNGMEQDSSSTGDHYTTYFRQYDARLGRFWSVDPVTHEWESPYAAMGGNPVVNIDPLGAATETGSEEDRRERDKDGEYAHAPRPGPWREGTIEKGSDGEEYIFRRFNDGFHWDRLRSLDRSVRAVVNLLEGLDLTSGPTGAKASNGWPYIDYNTALYLYGDFGENYALQTNSQGYNALLRHTRNAERLTELGQPVEYDEAIIHGPSPVPMNDPGALHASSRVNTMDLSAAAIGTPPMRPSITISNAGPGPKLLWTTWHEYPKVVQDGQEYAEIGGRLYSRHAVERMQPSMMRHSSDGETGGYPQIQGLPKPITNLKPGEKAYDYGRSVAPQFIEYVLSDAKPVLQENGNFSYTLERVMHFIVQK